MEKENKKIRAAIYSRISTQKQVDRTEYDSMQSHLDRCKHYIQSQEDWQLVKVYEDPAESGDKWQREKLQEMLADVKNGAVNVVLTFKLDRVSRSVRQFHEILKIFEENGVNLVSVTQGFDTSTPAGKLLRNILIDFAQFERDMISDRVKEKRLARAKKGLWNGGTPPYGYKAENRKLVVVPEEAETVRKIFDVYKHTKSRTKVREELELVGLRTRQGKPFSKGTIEAMLKNPVYAGKLFENGEIFDGMHKPIIDADLFFSVNQATPISYHKKRIRKTDKVFLLKGLVRCASHGCAMTPYFIMKKAGPIYYYLCTKKRQYRNLECPVGYANAGKLENYVVERLKEVSSQEPVFESIVNQVNLDLKSETLPYQKELEDVNQRISEVNKQIENFVEAVASSGRKAIHELLEKKVEKLQTDLAELKKRKSELAVIIASSPSKINARAVLQTLKDFSNLYGDLSPEEKAAYLRGVIQEVTVAEEDIAIRLHCLPIPSLLTGSTNRLSWLPGQDSNLQPSG